MRRPRFRSEPRASPPTAEELGQQAARCRALLKSSIVDFYLPAVVDTEHGGYFEIADANGTFQPSPDRFLSLQARQLWFFSTLAAEGISRDAALEAARVGYEILGRFRDGTHGGYHSKISVAGELVDPRKEICLNSFALYALAAYHRATGQSEPIERAQELFGVLEQHAYDRRYGGYLELFEPDWAPITDHTVRGYWASGGNKTFNGHMHLLESLAELYRVWPDDVVGARLNELAAINLTAFRHPAFNCNVTRLTREWQIPDSASHQRASYGHDLEGVWLTLDATRTLGRPDPALRGWAEQICGYSLKHGYDARHGGVYREGAMGRPADNREKEWWAQAETVVTMLELYRLTSKPEYFAVFEATLDFIESHQVAAGGGWWSLRNADGSAHRRGTLGSIYQDGYHSGRALLRCERLLIELSHR